jgi:hypothetical protein
VRSRARDQLLYLDLPVGSSGEGFDTWIDQHAYGWGAAVGAPPDDFFAGGQNWGFPPVRPDVARDEGHRLLAESLRHHMGPAGLLRLDHVMGLHRLFWVPDGMHASEGVYVRNATEEQFAVVHRVRRAGAWWSARTGHGARRGAEAMDLHRVLQLRRRVRRPQPRATPWSNPTSHGRPMHPTPTFAVRGGRRPRGSPGRRLCIDHAATGSG